MEEKLKRFYDYDNKPSRSNEGLRFLCPECGDGKPRDKAHQSLALNNGTGMFLCHRCGYAGCITENESPKKHFERPKKTVLMQKNTHVPPKPVDPTELFPIINTPAKKYLQSRGISVKVITALDGGYSSDFYGVPSVVFNVRDEGDVLVAQHGRAIEGGVKRSSGEISKGVFSTCGAFESPCLIITEAPIDALSLASLGYPAIATIGLGFPTWLVSKASGKEVFLAHDSDQAGEKAAESAYLLLHRCSITPKRLSPSAPAKDWNEALITNPILLKKLLDQALRKFYINQQNMFFVIVKMMESLTKWSGSPQTLMEHLSEQFPDFDQKSAPSLSRFLLELQWAIPMLAEVGIQIVFSNSSLVLSKKS